MGGSHGVSTEGLCSMVCSMAASSGTSVRACGVVEDWTGVWCIVVLKVFVAGEG